MSLFDDNGRIKIVDIVCGIHKIEGFSGHSDYNQIITYIRRMRPKLRQVIMGHGEKKKTENVSNVVSRMFRLPVLSPDVQEAIRIL